MFTFREFATSVYLPVARRRWKRSTAGTTEPVINAHLVEPLGSKLLAEITRDELQDLLDHKAPVLSFSVVDHLRWHLRAFYTLAISEGAADRNPAASIVTPKCCKAGRERRHLTREDINLMFEVLDLRERLVVKFAIFEGMRPGEILALRWRNLGEESFTVEARVYSGDLDTPKTRKSARKGGLSLATIEDLKAWQKLQRDHSPDGFVFPSENLSTPMGRDNLWRRNIQPRLETIALGWASFQVMRRANASLGRKAGIDDKVAADQRGHGLGVSLEVYADSDLSQKIAAVRKLEAEVIR